MFAVSFIASQSLMKLNTEEEIDLAGTSETSSETTRLENTDTLTYIYDAEDLSNFRDAVNAGDNYSGKTVYLMDDIDLSTVCSSTLGSWTPIGTTTTGFSGTFDGNGHIINNIYINQSTGGQALFRNVVNGKIINIKMKNGSVAGTDGNNAAIVANLDNGILTKCTNINVTVTGNSSTGGIAGTIQNQSYVNYCVNKANITGIHSVGGIAGVNTISIIDSCYNSGTIKTKTSGSFNNNYLAGGIAGYMNSKSSSNTIKIINCYNTGNVYGYVAASGITSLNEGAGKYIITNNYNVGTITGNDKSGILSRYSTWNGSPTQTINNNYWLSGCGATYGACKSGRKTNTGASSISAATLKTYTVTLGSAYAYDVYGINSGYPVLAWQNETTVMNLNKNQAYIKVGEELQLNVVETDEVTKVIGNDYSATNFKWTSTNEDVATINENGVVKGISDGYTTVYAYHETSGLYAMSVINVAKDFTNPQIETGNGFTGILKSDGTIWTIGNNASGQLGNGTTENSKIPVNVYIDEDTVLNNIVKIAVGTDHMVALTKDGNVYAWGSNTYGQLGQNNTNSSSYAKLVLSADGTSYLNNIVDVSANGYGTVALDKNGNVYVWGRGTTGEIGNSSTTSSNLPAKTTIKNAIQASMGDGHVGVLTSEGVVWSWGQNTNGQLGINCAKNTSYPMKTALKVTELSVGGYHTTVKKIDGTAYATGCYSYGRLGTGSTANVTTYVKVNLPNTVTETNKVKYVKAGIINTTLLLTDGTIWETGFNLQGELGNGATTTSTSFVQGLTKNGALENVLIVGRNNGNVSGSITTGYGLNTAVITINGDIYTTGDNSYGQIGDNTTTSTTYYTRMGFAYLDYEEKTVEIDENGYQIDLNKLKYIYSSINAYNNEQTYSLGEIQYTSSDETIVSIDEEGKITAKDGVSGITKIKIEDVTNGYETYLTVIVNKLENTNTVTYIYTIYDMVEFRNKVNSGDNYNGKTVYLMNDIDLSIVCSESLGSWIPIGDYSSNTNLHFSGIFEGNNHTIQNLYINETKVYQALFGYVKNGQIMNVKIEKGSVTAKKDGTASIAGCLDNSFLTGCINNNVTIIGATKAGGIVGSLVNKSIVNYSANNANVTGTHSAGGIAGVNFMSTINSCYNSGTIKTTTSGSFNMNYLAGGIVGYMASNSSTANIIVSNCYNTGNVYGYVGTGGITALNEGRGNYIITNNYSIGTLTGNDRYGIVSRYSTWNGAPKQTINNNYWLSGCGATYGAVKSGSKTNIGASSITSTTLKTYSLQLGTEYEDDDFNINNGYPILWWQAPTVELNKKQEYIKAEETLQLSIIQNDLVQNIFGREVQISDFAWSSTNEDVATVDENGLVTGVAEGYTTIYGYNEENGLYTMCVINVAKNEANPQVETGEGFTVILKADGTVWTIGKNENGELGDGTNEEKIEAVQVKVGRYETYVTDEETGETETKLVEDGYLSNVVKISVGTSHVLALTKDGKVYSWGSNTYGQLGQNSKENSNYATLVLGEGGSSTLERIVDISAGSWGSSAVNQFGWVYVWGNGTYGEMGNGTAVTKLTPTKTSLNTAISSSIGAGHVAVVGQNGKAYTWGRNSYGELGIGNTTNSTTVCKVAEGITDVSVAGYETILKNVNGEIYAAGLNTVGQLATGTLTNIKSFTKINLPETVTEENKVKYVKAGRTSTTLMLEDETVWTVGANNSGELGIGNNINQSVFVQAQTKEGNLENTIMIGRSSGETLSSNIAVINESGRVYTAGSNTYGQIGNNTKDNTNYFTVMGYITVEYDESINMHVGENYEISEDELAYFETYFNVYEEDIVKITLVNNVDILNEDIATYENAEGENKLTITAQNIGSTMLIVKEETTNILIYIPINVLADKGTVVPDVKTGDDYTVTLKADGTVWTFGTNENGELGLGENRDKNAPKEVEILREETVETEEIEEETEESKETVEIIKETIEQISVGYSHTLALTKDGKIYSWGLNKNGQLGIGSTKNSNIPQEVTIPEGTELVEVIKEKVVKVIANKNTSYAITQSGKVYAWGEGYQNTPKALSKDFNIIDISKAYALDIEGNVYDLVTDNRLEIVEKIKYISEGKTHTVFLSENGTAYSIGSNTYGQFGDGTNVSNTESVVAVRNEDVSDILRNILKIEAGNGYSAAVLNDGKLLEWGVNRKGQLGTAELEETNTIIENTAVTKLVSETNEDIMLLDAGANHVGIALTDGDVYTWGAGEEGQLGNGINDDKVEPQTVGKNIVESNTNDLVINENETFDIDASISYFNLLEDIIGEVVYESKDETVIEVDEITGESKGLQQGITTVVAREVGSTNISVIQVRVLPEGIDVEPQVKTNGSHTITLKADGTVWSYGNNSHGELGNGTLTYSDEPVEAIFEEGVTIVQVDAGENFSVALDSEGNVYTWGANDYYQLGNTKTGYITKPTKVEGISNITKIAAGTYSVLAIDENKEVYGWGLNSNGELGIGSYTNKISAPTRAKYTADVIDISVGKNHSIALKSTGEIYVTGLNIYGQLGNNDTSTRKINEFTKVENLSEVARISATDSGNIVSTVNGRVYSWGLNIYGELGLGDKTNRYEPVLVDEVENIVEVEGGKTHSSLLDKNGKVYVSGSNKYGQLGNGTKTESLQFSQINSLDNVMTISSGNTYTAIAKEDGTVWGFGDYNHGDKTLKSKTNSTVPMQVGNDSFGLGVTEVTIKKSETINLSSSLVYSFNLIYLDENNTETITYESMNEEIAQVNEYGEILGVKEGFTWIKAIEEDGTEHVVMCYVTDNQAEYAPRVEAGEDFASVLKADGIIYTFGHNNNGELGIGSNKTKDIPEKTNIISSYDQIKTGESFTIAIRNDGTVWSYGKNNYGQLGIGNTKNGLNSVQVNGITDIVQIAAGKEHSIAMDSYGILYGWGKNTNGQLGSNNSTVLTPTPISYTAGTISSIWAGENETIIINTEGKIYGYGNILNGTLEGITNAVKVSVGDGYMLILTTDKEVYKYDGSNLTKYAGLEEIVNIDVIDNNNIAQTVDEKVYTFKKDSTPVLENVENVYTIAAGANNSYVIKTDGTVYAKGKNQYGQLGNSTRIDKDEFTLVGDRSFTVEPESKIMYVNDVEELTEEIQGNEFNVFNRSVRNAEEYTWTSSNSEVVTVESGILTALSEGTSEITVTDKVTEGEVKLTRVVIPVEKDRIESIKVNDVEASIKDEYVYGVEVETNSNAATLKITTKDNTDKISIDGGETWQENGTLTSVIDIPNDETELEIIVETTNGTQIPYTLVVKKISTDVSLEKITVDGIQATATSSTNYEIVIPEDTDTSEIIAITNCPKAKVSINGESYADHEAIGTVEYENNIQVVIPIVVQAENGDEQEYSLTIYKESSILQLSSLTVEGKEAIKTSEGVYSITIARDLEEVEVTAKAISELVNVSINSENAEVQVSTKEVEITDEVTEVTIRLSTEVEGEEIYRDYKLNIYKKAESGKLEFVIVNGSVVEKDASGNYEIYLPAETEKATVKVIAENELDYVQIAENEKEQAVSEVEVETLEDSNRYSIKVIDDEENEESYTLYIKKPSVDASLKQIKVSNGEYAVEATKSTEEENVYIAKVKSYDNYEVKAITNNINAYVSIAEDTKVKNIATKTVEKTADLMEIKIEVESENGDIEEYTLKIYVMSSDTSLEFVKVNETIATLQDDGSYLVNLETAETEVSVNAQTMDENAYIMLENEEYKLHSLTSNVTIDSKDTVQYIYVKAEDGTTEKYKLVISGLPDDATLQKVTVNGVEAKYIEGENKYEVRSDSEEFEVEAIATDSLAKVSLNDNEEAIGSNYINITKDETEEITTVSIKVVAQDGVDSSTYTLEIKEKSNDSSIANVTVEGKTATVDAEGNYKASVVNSVELANIKVEANDSYATVYLDDETQNSSNITVTKQIADRETIYTIKVIAEDGTEEEHTLTVTKLENNVALKELTVTLEVEETTEVEDEEGNITEETSIVEKTYVPELKEDGTYYLKIDRVENVDVKAVLEDSNASVRIKNSEYVIAENEVNIETIAEKTDIVISVKAEDETIKEYTLIIEKKSNDTSIKTISSDDCLKLEDYTMYVDESLEETELTVVTTSDLASIKLSEEETYTSKQITRTIDLSEEAKVEDEQVSGWIANIEVQAEDGTVGTYAITILKTGNTNIDTVKVNEETIENVDDVFTARVNVADTANVEIATQNESAKIEIIQTTVADDETVTETVVASGTGTLVAAVSLEENPQNYTIRITSAKESTTYDYSLVIEQKSINTEISYVKVDNLNAIAKTEGNYISTVSASETYPLAIKLVDEKASVKIAYKDYVGEYVQGKLTEDIPVEEGEILEVTATVQAENGNEETYVISVTRISSNTSLEYVKVNDTVCESFDADTNTYRIIVDNTLTQANVEIKAVSDKANLTIGSTESVSLINVITGLAGEGTTKTISIKVEAEDGTVENYTLEIVQLSASVSMEGITVNDIEATKISVTEYEVTISNKEGIAKIVANATNEISMVSILGDESQAGSSTKTISVNNHEVIEVPIIITAEDESSQKYSLKITVQDSNNEVDSVKVNSNEVISEEDGITYKTFINYDAESADIEIKAESSYANVEITNSEELGISSQDFTSGVLNFTVATKEDVTTIEYKVTSESGESKEYTIVLTKISRDNTLKELYVGETLVEVGEDGEYNIEVYRFGEVEVKAIANNEYASIRIDYNEEEKQETTATVNLEELSTKVIITITSQSGETAKYNLYIQVSDKNTELDKVIVDSVEVTDYKEETTTYTALVENGKDEYEVFIMAMNNNVKIELYDGEELLSSGIGSLTDVVTLETEEEAHTYKVKVSADEENVSNYTLHVVRISNDATLKLIEVNDVARNPSETDPYVYEVGIPKLAEKAKIKVVASNSYATVRIGDNQTVQNGATVEVDISLSESRITVPVVVTATDGETIATYNIILTRLENNTNVAKVQVNDKELTADTEGNYEVSLTADDEACDVIVETEDEYAKITIGNEEFVGVLEESIELDATVKETVKTIKITAQDGTVAEHTLTIKWLGRITEIVKTQVVEGKDHIATIKVYESNSEENEAGEREVLQEIQTNAEGLYELDLVPGEYDILIEKASYLDTEITNIVVAGGRIIELGERQIYAGDVNDDEQIEISDLTAVTYNYGTVEEDNELARYDLNEDGVVNKEDRNIIKGNYNKKKTTIVWIDPEIEVEPEPEPKPDFIIPITTEYKITSPYGTRIHPATGEVSKHTGIDIQGEWHTEILAAAGGEVVFAGDNGAFGNSVEIKHVINGVEIYTFYAHLSRIDVEVGDTVEQGQVIGLEGGDPTRDENPGTSTGHHLHFEVRTASGYGNDVDPTKYIEF